MAQLEVFNPVAEIRGDLKPQGVSPRVATLEGSTLGLLWSGTTNGDVALRRVERHMRERFPKVQTKFFQGDHPFAERLLREVADTGGLLVATHLPFPSVGHVAVDGDAFRWVPVFWDY